MKRTQTIPDIFGITPIVQTPRPVERSLFDDASGKVTYQDGFLTRAEADDLFRFLSSCTLKREKVVVRGKTWLTSRFVRAFGDPGLTFEYSGTRTSTGEAGWGSPLLEALVARIREHYGVRPNFVHVNLYPTGEAKMGYHSDFEEMHVPGLPIFSVSVGAERRFLLRPKAEPKKPRHEVRLKHGSLLTMQRNTQKNWQHSVPAALGVKTARYNLTFRCFKVQK